MAMPIIVVEDIRFTRLVRSARCIESEAVSHFGIGQADAIYFGEHWTSADPGDGEAGLRLIEEGLGPVIGDIKIEKSVAIDIGECHGGAARLALEPAFQAFGEMPMAIVEEQAGSAAEGIDQQVEVAVAIDIGQDGTGGNLSRTGDASGSRYIFKLPVS